MTAIAERPNGHVEVTGVPADVAAAVRDVYVATGGAGMAPAVLEAARDASNPMHRYFDWDDSSAAEAYRLSQAEALVRRVRVTIIPAEDAPPIKVRAYVSRRELPADESEDTKPGSFLAIEDVASETARQTALLQSIERDVMRLRQKYRNVAEFAEVVRGLLDD